jgi:protein TonB
MGSVVMNASALRRIVEEDSEAVSVALPLSGFERQHGSEQNKRFRPAGIGLAIGVHVFLILGFLVAGPSIIKKMPTELTVVSIAPEQQEKVDLPPPPKLQPIVQPQVEMPQVVIDTPPQQTTITVTPPKPVAQVSTPVSVSDNKSYFSRLLAKLYSYKRYPEAARLKREKGIAVIRIVMERNGMVSGVTLVKSSGSDTLDQEALALPTRAQPLPSMPDSMTQQQLTMNVNVDFTRIN